MAYRGHLLQEHEAREPHNPIEIHHPAEEQKAHEEPAATDTIRAMFQAHTERTQFPISPMRGNEVKR